MSSLSMSHGRSRLVGFRYALAAAASVLEGSLVTDAKANACFRFVKDFYLVSLCLLRCESSAKGKGKQLTAQVRLQRGGR